MRNFLLCLIAIFIVAAPVYATDYVLKYIDCPTDINITLDFVNHIGSDPTFSEAGSGGMASRGHGNSIHREGQKISCSYRGTGIFTGRSATYSYTVHRKILDCKPLNNMVLQCRLEP